MWVSETHQITMNRLYNHSKAKQNKPVYICDILYINITMYLTLTVGELYEQRGRIIFLASPLKQRGNVLGCIHQHIRNNINDQSKRYDALSLY